MSDHRFQSQPATAYSHHGVDAPTQQQLMQQMSKTVNEELQPFIQPLICSLLSQYSMEYLMKNNQAFLKSEIRKMMSAMQHAITRPPHVPSYGVMVDNNDGIPGTGAHFIMP